MNLVTRGNKLKIICTLVFNVILNVHRNDKQRMMNYELSK